MAQLAETGEQNKPTFLQPQYMLQPLVQLQKKHYSAEYLRQVEA